MHLLLSNRNNSPIYLLNIYAAVRENEPFSLAHYPSFREVSPEQ